MYKLKYFIIFYVPRKVFSLFIVINLDPIFDQIQQTDTDYEWKQVFTIDRKSYFMPVTTASHNKKF